jgi:hypothetical protein
MSTGLGVRMTSPENKMALPKPLNSFMEMRVRGHVAEWLRSGLQNRLPRFNSGRGLQTVLPN